jgi:hypothetical protein
MTFGHSRPRPGRSWLAFRDLPWFGDRHPRLAAFSHRPSMTSTPLSGQTHDQ